MNEARHENSSILDNVGGVAFLGTPHAQEESFHVNVLEAIVRTCSRASVSFISFTEGDNEQIARISRDFLSFDGDIISAFEILESKYPRQIRHFWKGHFSKPRVVRNR